MLYSIWRNALDRFQAAPRQQQEARLQSAPQRPALPSIQRNAYPEPDRQQAQERIATAIEADPEPFVKAYHQRPDSLGGRYICSDLFKETFPEFAASNEGRSRFNNPFTTAPPYSLQRSSPAPLRTAATRSATRLFS
jgi:hypothetical protein